MFYLGIDVAKAKLDCSLILDPATHKRKSKIVPNTRSGLATLIEWTAKQGVTPAQLHVIMEATGVYHERAAFALTDAGITVSIVNPAQVRDLARSLAVRTKTDGVDSFILARFGVLLQPPAWQPPPAEIRALRALLARRDALADNLQRERNREETHLAPDSPTLVEQSIADTADFLAKELERLQQAIYDHIDQHPSLKNDMALLMSIPAIGLRTGICLLTILTRSVSERLNKWLPIWVWCPLSGSPAVLYKVVHAYPKPGLPGFERFYTWPLSLLKRIMLMSRRFTKNCWDAVNQKCQPWGPLCASLSIYALV